MSILVLLIKLCNIESLIVFKSSTKILWNVERFDA